MTAVSGLAEPSTSVVAPARPTVEELFSAHANFVWRNLRRFGVRSADLEDVTHDVFLVAHRKYPDWDGAHERAWLFAIARRCASAYRRRAHRTREIQVDEVPDLGVEGDPSTRAELERLDRALAMLDEDKRNVLLLYETESMSMREVAIALGCLLPTAYARLYAARRELARAFREPR
ncbi:RNA polymerase sigma factor [Labilithrix luteola]|uniref:RNA polymerase sigma factor n=1 Tax=Labilithrix luteola TaxID=1391654 RepID=UPI00147507CE|nr:sigma-70 family RNA polymerase sigma factor [Labilithrix luteola]